MSTGEWERGYAAGFQTALTFAGTFAPQMDLEKVSLAATPKLKAKKKRKTSAYSKKYGRAFKKLQSKYKTKAGKWKKDGFKRCQKAAHALAKRMN